MKVLIVDDDPFIRDVLVAVLEGADYSVETAESGEQALAAFNGDRAIGLVISDMNMPGMNGLELMGKIRDAGSDLPVIILTGDDELAAGNSGADDYLLKDEHIQDTIIPSVKRVLEKGPRR
jgi:CheY-like chemotaxis protein